jgi:hypothetical protein
MSNRSTATITTKEKSSAMPMRSSLIQRKCACGNSAGMAGECSDCQKKSLVQRKSIDRDNTSEVSPIAHEFPIQTKLTVGAPGDIYEQEADRVAAQVMSMGNSSPSIQPARAMGEKEVQTNRSSDGESQAGSNIESQLSSSKGGGSPLPDGVRSFMEPRFSADFSQVRVHTGYEAAQMNQRLNAQAFTHQQDIYFGAGKAPSNDALTAHELTHVAQQMGIVQTKEYSEQSTDKSNTLAYQKDNKFEMKRESNLIDVSTIQRQIASPPGGFDPCLSILEQIIELLNEVAKRIKDALDDPHQLFKYYRSTKSPHPEYGSWDGHRDRFHYDRDRLRQKIAEWESNDNCKGYPLSSEQKSELGEAIEFKDKEFPGKPAPAMREVEVEIDLSDKIANALRKFDIPNFAIPYLVALVIADLADPEPFSKVVLIVGTAAAILIFMVIGRQSDVPAGGTQTASIGVDNASPPDQNNEEEEQLA